MQQHPCAGALHPSKIVRRSFERSSDGVNRYEPIFSPKNENGEMESHDEARLEHLGYCALIGVVAAWAQPARKSGLWIIASTTRILQPGETPGNFVARGNDGDGQLPPAVRPPILRPN